MENSKKGLNLDRVVLLGRTLDEYLRYFALDPAGLNGLKILDVAGGVSSFCAEATALGLTVQSVDPIYALDPRSIRQRCESDLHEVAQHIGHLPVYRWNFYGSPDGMRKFRQQASMRFLADFNRPENRYMAASLPNLPFKAASFDLVLVSYLLFVYQDQFNYGFHKASVRELARVSRGELRIYPLVTFEADRSVYLETLCQDPDLEDLQFEVRPTDFEFLANSNCVLIVRRRSAT